MKIKNMLPISILIMATLSNQAVALFLPGRCQTYGDSLDSEQAAGRRAWTTKCFPLFRGQILAHNLLVDSISKETRPGYPTLRFTDENGYNSNPQNWFAPTKEEAPCEYPEGYQIVNYCAVDC